MTPNKKTHLVWHVFLFGRWVYAAVLCCGRKSNAEGEKPFTLHLCGNNDREGVFPSCHACVEGNMMEGVSPFLSRLCGIKHDGKGAPLVVPVWKDTRRKGFPPSCCVCVE